MKKNNLYILVFALALSMFNVSCNKEVLDTAPSDQISSELAVANVGNARATLFGAYSRFRSGLYYTGTFTALGDIMTGNVALTTVNTGQYAITYRYDINSATQDIDDMWNRGYSIVGNLNPVIAAMPSYENVNDPDIDEKDQVLGEAHLLRALVFFDLMRTYGDRYNASSAATDLGVPIPETLIVPDDKALLPRSSAQEVFDYILADISTALSLFDGAESDKTRVNDNAAYALLSRVNLYMGRYQEAISAANNVSGVSLIDNVDDFADFWLNSDGNELIWKIGVTPTDGANQFGWTYLFDVSSTLRQNYVVTNDLLNLYESGDYRTDVYYDVLTSSSDGVDRNTVIKYPDNPTILQSGVVEIMPFRYAEVLLNRMEAYAETNQPTLALADLNTLRNARGLGDVSLSGSALLNEIRDERRRELAFEGHYWHDLKRWNLDMVRIEEELCTDASCIFTVPASSKFWLFPLPTDEISNNPVIADQQAPGY